MPFQDREMPMRFTSRMWLAIEHQDKYRQDLHAELPQEYIPNKLGTRLNI